MREFLIIKKNCYILSITYCMLHGELIPAEVSIMTESNVTMFGLNSGYQQLISP